MYNVENRIASYVLRIAFKYKKYIMQSTM